MTNVVQMDQFDAQHVVILEKSGDLRTVALP
jgi:hypothetical protein